MPNVDVLISLKICQFNNRKILQVYMWSSNKIKYERKYKTSERPTLTEIKRRHKNRHSQYQFKQIINDTQMIANSNCRYNIARVIGWLDSLATKD